MKIALIVAMDNNRGIGLNGAMPWHLSADLKRFKHITMGNPVVMGRKTYESIGKPLPGRKNYILSRDSTLQVAGCEVVGDLDVVINACASTETLFVIGGAALYAACLESADLLYITEIHHSYEADTFFPALELDAWELVESQEVPNDALFEFPYTFKTFRRKKG
jgi:dihydrofolate reductase